MTLYSFKGHYPVEQIDSNEGWYEVPAKPEAPEGKEVRWENAEWVVRDPKPADRPGYQWNWNHAVKDWVECVQLLTDSNLAIGESSPTVTTVSGVSAMSAVSIL